jgi:periplasmic protein TonB
MQLFEPNPSAQPAVLGGRGPMRRNLALVLSVALHGVGLVLLCWRPAIFVKPRLIAHGEGGTATPASITLYLPQDAQMAPPVQQALLALPAPVQKTRKTKLQKRTNNLDLENDKRADSAEAGSPEGSAFDGPAEGDEIRPAIPLPGSFADPKVSRWELPGGLQGDVIVEITIDNQGLVVEERLLQGMGHGIDEKVIAALRDWRFRPATRNGMAIPSKHDVHFHFPS